MSAGRGRRLTSASSEAEADGVNRLASIDVTLKTILKVLERIDARLAAREVDYERG